MPEEDAALYEPKRLAETVTAIISNGTTSQEVSDFFEDEDRCLCFLEPFLKSTPLHLFISWIVDSVLSHETNDTDLEDLRTRVGHADLNMLLPVDAALRHYGFKDDGFGDFLSDQGKKIEEADADDIFDYVQELQGCGRMEELGTHVAEIVHPLLFEDRALMREFNELVASHVAEMRIAELDTEYALLFESDGKLHSVATPGWARKAIVAREQARCAVCRAGATGGVVVPLVPLSEGGVNDVTNLELRCMKCDRA